MVGVVVVGLLGGMVAMVFASGSHVFGGIGSIFPLFMMVGIMMMMFRGMGGGQQQMSRPKLDAMRAQFMLMLDMLRETAQESADSMDANYRWFHPAPNTLAAAVGSPRMWERKPDGKDLNFGVVRVGVGMTRPEVTWGEPQNMPTDIELEPVTGKALQEFRALPKRRVQPAENGFAAGRTLVCAGRGTRAGSGFDAGDHLPAGVLPRA